MYVSPYVVQRHPFSDASHIHDKPLSTMFFLYVVCALKNMRTKVKFVANRTFVKVYKKINVKGFDWHNVYVYVSTVQSELACIKVSWNMHVSVRDHILITSFVLYA